MPEANESNPNLNFLAEFSKAMKYAEAEEKQVRHGSSLSEYEAARRLGEVLAALENDPVMDGKIGGVVRPCALKAVRDLPDNAGCELIMTYRGKDHRLVISFEELREIGNVRQDNDALVDKWRRQLKSSATLIAETPVVRGTAKSAAKKLPAKNKQAKTLTQ